MSATVQQSTAGSSRIQLTKPATSKVYVSQSQNNWSRIFDRKPIRNEIFLPGSNGKTCPQRGIVNNFPLFDCNPVEFYKLKQHKITILSFHPPLSNRWGLTELCLCLLPNIVPCYCCLISYQVEQALCNPGWQFGSVRQ